MRRYGLNSCGSGWDQAGCNEHDNKYSDSVNAGKVLTAEQLLAFQEILY
jgi:hypothetical protein